MIFPVQFNDVRKRKSQLVGMDLGAEDNASALERRRLMRALKKRVDHKLTQSENYRSRESHPAPGSHRTFF